MVNRPTAYPRWATDGGALVTEPPEGPSGGATVTKSDGWVPGNAELDYDNWHKNITYNWAAWLDQISFRSSDLHPNHALPGGTPPAIGAGLGILANAFSAAVYADGYRVSAGFGVSLVTGPAANYNYSATSDTYWDLSRAGVWTPVVVASGDPEPAVTANSTRVYGVRTDASDRTLLLVDRRAERVRQNAPIDMTHGAAVPGGGSAADRAVASFRWKYPDGGSLYTLLFESEDDGAAPARGVRFYLKESNERIYVVQNARWNAATSEWDYDGGAVTATRIALNGPALDACSVTAGASFVDSLWDAMPSGANGVTRGISQLGGTISRSSQTERFSLEDVPAFAASNTAFPGNIHRHFIADYGHARIYAIQDETQGTDYGGGTFGGFGLEIVTNAEWIGDNTTGEHWDRIDNAFEVFKFTIDRRGATLQVHRIVDGNTWNDLEGTGDWSTVFAFTDPGAAIPRNLFANIFVPNTNSAAVPLAHGLYRDNVVKGWAVITTDGVGGVAIDSSFGITAVSLPTNQVLRINLARAMTSANWGVSVGAAPGRIEHQAGSTNQKDMSFIDHNGASVNLATNAVRIELSVFGIHA